MSARTAGSLRLPASRRIKTGRDFRRIRAEGRRVGEGSILLNWLEGEPGSVSRLGVVVSRRVGNAVVRSRARRLLREAFRTNQRNMCRPAEVVLIARPSIAQQGLTSVAADLMSAFRRARLV
jgi:ribonuclease P protein component